MKWGYVIIVLVVVLAALAIANEEGEESIRPIISYVGSDYFVDGLELRFSEIEERIKKLEDKFVVRAIPRSAPSSPDSNLITNVVGHDQ
jgi:hypothetical protein